MNLTCHHGPMAQKRPATIIVGALLLAGCLSDATQLVVVVDSDLAVPAELARARASLRDQSALISENTFTLAAEDGVAPPGSFQLPLSFGVVPQGDPESEVQIVVEAIGASDVLFSRSARTHFVESETRRLVMFLARRCTTETCAEGSTCTENGCTPELVDPTLLALVEPGSELEGLPDAGVRDAEPDDSGPLDAASPIEEPSARLSPSPPYELNLIATNPNRPEVRLGQAVTFPVTLANAGDGTLIVSGVEITDDARASFSLVGVPALPAELAANRELVFRIEYEAAAIGTDSARLELSTNDSTQGAGTGKIVAELSASTSPCPDAPFTEPGAMASRDGICAYVCTADHHDVDPDPGCEYACTKIRDLEDPDDLFLDENCDGVDGNALSSYFVAPPPLGSDSNAGTRLAPFATIGKALDAASIAGTSVLVSKGDYSENLSLKSGVSIFGGYDAGERWVRRADSQSRLIAHETAVSAIDLPAKVVLDRIHIRTSSATLGAPTIGLWVVGSDVEVRSSSISVGHGAPGVPGAQGAQGVAGAPGGAGQPGDSGGSANGGGGGPGVSSCAPETTGSGGGIGGYDNGAGAPGEPNGALAAGPGGAGAAGCATCSSCNGPTHGAVGSDGSPGTTPGTVGTDGLGASSAGVWVLDEWVPGAGEPGGPGTYGSGGSGGGGGGGGANDCYANVFSECVSGGSVCNADRGGGGGGGGGGGCGAEGGQGGGGGGASFGVVVLRSTVALDRTTVSVGDGGAGGAGGEGGPVGPGGPGGEPGQGRDDSGAGGRGGAGAPGGAGGSGGGGAGGSSWCVYVGPSSTFVETSATFNPGSPGPGGTGANPGPPGEGGIIRRD